MGGEHSTWPNLPNGGQGWAPTQTSLLARCSQEECESIIVCVLCRKPILYALSAAADLDDLTVFIMMMNKSKVLEE